MVSRLAATFVVVFLAGSASAQARDLTQRVELSAGASGKTIKGSLKGGDSVTYLISAKAGQVAHILFSPSNRSCYFNVSEEGAAEAIHVGSISGNEFGKNLTADAAYRVQVYLMRNAARRNERCRYDISFEITGKSGVRTEPSSDSAMRKACQIRAATMYGVSAAKIELAAELLSTGARGFALDGTADKGRDGLKTLRCVFTPDRDLDDVMAMTPDGE